MRLSRFLLSRAVFTSLIGLLAAAASAGTIVLTPAVVPLSGGYGQGVTHVLTLRNEFDQPLDFVMEARDVVVRDGSRVFVEAGQLPDSAAASAVFSPRTVRVGPRSSASVSVTITLPPAMRHRAVAVFFKGADLVKTKAGAARLSLGSLFTFTLSDKLSIAASALETAPPTATRNAQFRTRLVNDGAEPVVPAGVAMIVDAQGRPLGKVAFEPRRLLPGEAQLFVADYAGDIPPGTYRVVATLDVAGRPVNLDSSLQVR